MRGRTASAFSRWWALGGAAVAALAVAGTAVPSTENVQPGPRLEPIGEIGPAKFGISVALSADGSTALAGGSSDGGGIGAAWAFTKRGGPWRQEGRKLVAKNEFDNNAFGLRVALSADGKTALVGGPLLGEGAGAAWVFVRSRTNWRQVTTLTPRREAGRSSFGESVALSADGKTAIVGGPTDALGAGAAWVFTRTGAGWKQQGGKLTAKGEVGPGRLGVSVALSSDGRTAILGAPLDANDIGAVWVFTRSGSGWRQRGGKLAPHGTRAQTQFGSAVALSARGTTALVGAPVDRDDVGTVWVFARSGSTWRQQGTPLAPSGKPGTVQFGGSVALSGSGDVALIGGATNNGDVGIGRAWLFRRSGARWSQQGAPLTARGERGLGGFGSSVAVSSDGKTAVVGAYNDDHGNGGVWTFGV